MLVDPHSMSLSGLQHSAYVRFSVLALSSIFFLVDPFAALPTFLAVTAGADETPEEADCMEGVADGSYLSEPLRARGAVHLQDVWNHAAGV